MSLTPPSAASSASPPDGMTAPTSTGRPVELLRTWVTAIATMLAGLLAGFFVTYTISVTRGLAITRDATYVEAIDAINATVVTPVFAVMFFGAPATAVLATAVQLPHLRRPATWACAVAAVALLASFAITAAINVPLNRELAELAAAGEAPLAEVRTWYEPAWNRANLARAWLSTTGFAALLIALRNPGVRR
jgi:uncharacterized membrane protein